MFTMVAEIFNILMVIVVILPGARPQTVTPLALESLCSSTSCDKNTSCRIIQTCSGSICPPKASCIDCVPKGTDDVCNRNAFASAVLVGSVTQPSGLIGRGCDHNQPSGEPNCPSGSVCVPDDQSSRGTCCYAKLDSANPSGPPDSKNDSFCPSECGECPPEHVCRKIPIVCKRLPCLPKYDCVVRDKKGSCPRYSSLGSSWCPRNKRIRCNTDSECLGSQKCCSYTCGGLRCKKPRN